MADSYQEAHRKVRKARGKASDYVCPCGTPARDWAFQYTAREPLFTEDDKPRVYSMEPSDYEPLCRGCHQKFDIAHDRVIAELRSDRMNRYWEKYRNDPEVQSKHRANALRNAEAARSRRAEVRSSDPEHSKKSTAAMVATLVKNVECDECGLVSTPGGIGRHQKCLGHRGRTKKETA